MESSVLRIENFSASYGEHSVLKEINLSFFRNTLTAVIGPSGCGKTTLIRCINRMHELVPDARVSGKILLDNQDIYDTDPIIVRRQIGMVFQRPNPFPTMSIYDNVIAGYNLNGIKLSRAERDHTVEESLKKAALWQEVKNSLHRRGTFLSGGQQQRLCIARAVATDPEVLLMDEPCSALDPIATRKIEELMLELKKRYTIAIVTHNLQQAQRVADETGFLYVDTSGGGRTGYLVEFGNSKEMFASPKEQHTKEYIRGEFS